MNIDSLRLLFPTIKILQEAQIDLNGDPVGWHYCLLLEDGTAIGNGTHQDKDLAKTKCIAEAFERGLIKKVIQDEKLYEAIQYADYPSSCGFAVGLNESTTKKRSIFEAIERWALSKWIDTGCSLNRMAHENVDLTPMSIQLVKNFSSYEIFKKEIEINLHGISTVNFVVFVGFCKNGAYLGTNVSDSNAFTIDHACIEAWRNMKITHTDFLYKQATKSNDMILKRVVFFSNNKQKAINILSRTREEEWPKFKLKFSRKLDIVFDNIFLYRSIAENYMPLDLGKKSRFVY